MASFSCKRLLTPFNDEDVVVASVGERKLLSHDLNDLFNKSMTSQDSIAIMESYVNMWVRNQLKLEKAELMFSESQDDIDRMVEEYRNSLLNYKLDQHYIEKSINLGVTNNDIKDYYNKNSKAFRLDKDIIKGLVVKVPKKYRQSEKLQELMNSQSRDKQQDFIDICDKNNFNLVTFDKWTDFSEFIDSIPTKNRKLYTTILNRKGVQDTSDDSYKYFFKIYEKRIKGDISPIELTKDKVRQMILNQRRVDVITAYEDSLYNKAIQERRISINIHKSTDSLETM